MLKRVLALSLCFVLAACSRAYAADAEPPSVSAECAAVADCYGKSVLYDKNMYERRPIASITKIMTCLIACESGDLNRAVTVKEEILYGTEGTLIYLKTGDRITLLDLIKGALIASGNDAANAIAFAVSGSAEKFADLMNKKADELKMTNTNFVTPSGLDSEGHYSCAYDMAVLCREAMKNSVFRDIVKRKFVIINISGKSITLYNHNKLLSRDKNFIGVKTGYTKKAGRCLVSVYKYNDAEIIIVTLNAPDDWDDHLSLVNYAKKSYNNKNISGEINISAVGSSDNYVKCSYGCGVTAADDVYVKLYYYPFVYYPYKNGDPVGYALILENGNVIKKADLIVSN